MYRALADAIRDAEARGVTLSQVALEAEAKDQGRRIRFRIRNDGGSGVDECLRQRCNRQTVLRAFVPVENVAQTLLIKAIHTADNAGGTFGSRGMR